MVAPQGASKAAESSQKEEVDRELKELLEEVRIALPGIQVLAAFLLTVVFTSAFRELSDGDRVVFFAGFMSALSSAVLLLSAPAHHRLLWRRQNKDHLVASISRITFLATILIGVAFVCVTFVVVDFVYGARTALILSACLAALMMVVWYGIPLLLLSEMPRGRTKPKGQDGGDAQFGERRTGRAGDLRS
jgi:hypothetical protein